MDLFPKYVEDIKFMVTEIRKIDKDLVKPKLIEEIKWYAVKIQEEKIQSPDGTLEDGHVVY